MKKLPELEIIEEAISWRQFKKKVVLATVISTWGSSPFEIGTKMIINEDGNFFGSVSGGCVETNVIVIMQAANTGLTGGSTPFGDDYDRPIIVINTMRISDIHIINSGKQIIGFPGSTLFDLENQLSPYGREPH